MVFQELGGIDSVVQFTNQIEMIGGGHIVYVFREQDEYLRNLVSFIDLGLRLGHTVLVAESEDIYEKALKRLKAQGHSRHVTDQIVFADCRDLYAIGQTDDTDRIVSRLQAIVQPFIDKGRTVRTWGRVIWDGQEDLTRKVRFYESCSAEYVKKCKTLSVCAYEGSKLSGDVLLDLMGSHQYVMNDSELMESTPSRNSAGSVRFPLDRGLDYSIYDIERHRERLERVNKLETISETVFHVAHEVRNPMTAIRGLLELMRMRNRDENEQELIDTTIAEIDRANTILSDFMSLGKKQTLDLKAESLNSLIASMASLIDALAKKEGKNLALDLNEVPELFLDAIKIKQVLLNLVRNGIEAMETGGTVTIRTLAYRDGVVLAIEDEGHGIPAEVRKKIGTPFFTTKDHGTGLGLAACYKIVEQHNGQMRIDTGGSGTAIRIHFPESLMVPGQEACATSSDEGENTSEQDS